MFEPFQVPKSLDSKIGELDYRKWTVQVVGESPHLLANWTWIYSFQKHSSFCSPARSSAKPKLKRKLSRFICAYTKRKRIIKRKNNFTTIFHLILSLSFSISFPPVLIQMIPPFHNRIHIKTLGTRVLRGVQCSGNLFLNGLVNCSLSKEHLRRLHDLCPTFLVESRREKNPLMLLWSLYCTNTRNKVEFA